MSLKIIIPSRARPDKLITVPQLQRAGIPFTIARTASDKTVYPADLDQIVFDVDGIMEKRNAILDAFGPKFMMIDDDIIFKKVVPHPSGPIVMEMLESELRRMFELVEHYLDTYAHVGIAQRYMIQNRPQPFQLNRRFLHCLGFNKDLFPDPAPRYRLKSCSDADFNMQLLAAKKSSLLITEYIHEDLGYFVSAGGCSEWRTVQVSIDGHEALQANWPKYVRLKEAPPEKGGRLATILYAKLAKDNGLPT